MQIEIFRQVLAKNIKLWRLTRKEPCHKTAKKINNVTVGTINLWEKTGRITHDNLYNVALVSGIPAGLFLLSKEDKEMVQQWLDNDCNIVQTIMLEE